MVDVQTIGVLVTAVSVSIAAIYYAFTLRINLKNQELSLKTQELALKAQQQAAETRQAQLFMQIYSTYSGDFQDAYGQVMTWEWKDLDDFTSKYYDRKSLDVINKVSAFQEGLGILVYNKLVDKQLLYDLAWHEILLLALRFGPVSREIQERRNEPEYGKYAKFLAEEFMRIYEERHGRRFSPDLEPIVKTRREKPRVNT